MALINCPECGKEISDTCKTCMHCGFNLKKYLKEQNVASKDKKKIGKKSIFVVIGLVIIVLLGLFYLQNRMPNLVGLTKEEAITILDDNGIEYSFVEELSYEYSEGIVSQQSKSANSLYFNNEPVQIGVSSGKKIKVPELVGQNYEEIKDLLEGANVQVNYCGSRTEEEGVIISASKSNQDVLEGDTIVIQVSEGIIKSVPNVIGKSKADAIKELEDLGLVVKCVEQLTTDKIAVGEVFGYTPAKYIKEGEEVTLSISSGHGVYVRDYIDREWNSSIERDLKDLNVTYSFIEKYANMTTDCNGNSSKKVVGQNISGVVEEGTEIVFSVTKPAITISQVDWDINYVGGVDTYITFKNNTDKEIAYIEFEVQYFDRVGNPAKCEVDRTSTQWLKFTGPLAAGKTSSDQYWRAVHYNSAVAAIQPDSATVKFTDGTQQVLTYTGRYWYGRDFYGGSLNE